MKKAEEIEQWAIDGYNVDSCLNQHTTPFATHYIFEEEDEKHPIGAFSVKFAPLVFFSMLPARANKFLSFKAWQATKKELKKLGFIDLIVAVQDNSKYYPYLERLGLNLIGACKLFHQPIN